MSSTKIGRSISEFNLVAKTNSNSFTYSEKISKKKEKNKKRAERRKAAYEAVLAKRIQTILTCFETITDKLLIGGDDLYMGYLPWADKALTYYPRSCSERQIDMAKCLELTDRIRMALSEAIHSLQLPFHTFVLPGNFCSFICKAHSTNFRYSSDNTLLCITGFSLAVALDRNYDDVSTCEIGLIDRENRLCYPNFATSDYNFQHDVICFDKIELFKVFKSVLQLFNFPNVH